MLGVFFKNSIFKNLIASWFGIAVNLFTQIVLVPFFLKQWGIDKYGDWIILTSVSNLFLMSDVGLNTVMSNQFSIKMSEGNERECNSLLMDNFLLLLIVSFLGILGTFVFVDICDLKTLLNLSVIRSSTANIIFVLLVIQIFFSMFSGVLNAIYRAKSLAYRYMYIDNIVRLIEGFILLVGLLLYWPVELLSVFYIMPKILVLIYKYFDVQQVYLFKFRKEYIDLSLLKKLILPSVSFMSFPLANAVILQGYTLFVNKYFGSESVVLYTTTRTLCNFVKMVMATINTSVWPEFSIAYGKKDYNKMSNIHNISVLSSFFISLIISLILLVAGPFIYSVWTKNLMNFNFSLMLAFVIVLIVNNIWFTSSVVLASTNNHSIMGGLYVLGACLSLLLAFIIHIYYQSLIYTTYSLLLVDVLLSVYVLKASYKLIQSCRY